ncbi:MAG: hypothetical protein NHB32_23100 [Fischerella sp. CENA71]|nr:hypothetical protein [Fischerella sp. CENA71]
MNKIFKRAFLPGLLATSLVGASFVPAKPASADEYILQDLGIGAGAGVVTGAVRGRGSVVNNAVKGAAAGAAVNAVHGTRRQYQNRQKRNVVQDVGVGAAAGAVTGTILRGNTKHVVGDAVDGAITGGAINVLTNGRRQ